MSQMGHSSTALSLEVYARVVAADPGTGKRVDALVRGPQWEPAEPNASNETEVVMNGL
jgi:hypothetical protein